jgi:intein/homing endonuclease
MLFPSRSPLNALSHQELQAIAADDPLLYAQLKQRLEIIRDQDEKERCENSLIEFFICAWHHMGEPTELVLNWHHEVIAAELELQAQGLVPNIVLNQPPRTSKSGLCSVALPAWIWTQPKERWSHLMGPHVQFFCLSYGTRLALEIATKHRLLVMGEWYQKHWGHQVEIREDQGSKDNFATKMGGSRISNSIEGGILGRGGIWQLIDDPHSTKGAESSIQRAETLDGMRALTTRINNPKHAARLLVMQRLHEDDATNYALENWGRVKHLIFPMRYDERRGIPEDPRRIEGELLWPAMWDERSVRREERELQEYGSAGQLQQSPVPKGGGIIQRQWWRLWPDDAEKEAGYLASYKCDNCGWRESIPFYDNFIECRSCRGRAERNIEFPEHSFRLLSVDTNYGEKEANSYSAATLWSIWHDEDESPRLMLTEAWRGRPKLRTGSMTNPGLMEKIHSIAMRRNVDVVLIERKTRGQDLYDEMDRLTREYPFRLEFFEPTGRGDKAYRLNTCVPVFTNDMVWAPNKKWADSVIDEVCVVGDTQIVTLDGIKPASEVAIGDMVLTHRGRFRPVVETMRRDTEEIVKVDIAGLDSILLTGKHPFYAMRTDIKKECDFFHWCIAEDLWNRVFKPATRDGRVFQEATLAPHDAATMPIPVVEEETSEIDLRDWIVLPNSKKYITFEYDEWISTSHSAIQAIRWNQKLDYQFGRIVGLYLAEGSSNRGQVSWSFHEEEREFIDEVKAFVTNRIGCGSHERTQGRGTTVCAAMPLLEGFWLECGKHAKNKRIPSWAWNAPIECIRGIWDGLIDGDGCRENGQSEKILLTTVSPSLAWGIRLLTYRLGRQSSLRWSDPTGEAFIHGKKIKVRQRVYHVRWNPLRKNKGHFVRTNTHIGYSVLNVEKIKEHHRVYNFSVFEDESYCTTAGAVHNCSQTPDGRAKFSDFSDCVSMAIIYLRQNGYLSLKHEHSREKAERSYFRGKSTQFSVESVFGDGA